MRRSSAEGMLAFTQAGSCRHAWRGSCVGYGLPTAQVPAVFVDLIMRMPSSQIRHARWRLFHSGHPVPRHQRRDAAPTAASRTSSSNRSISPPVASRRGLKSSSSMQCHRKTSSAMTRACGHVTGARVEMFFCFFRFVVEMNSRENYELRTTKCKKAKGICFFAFRSS